MAQAVDRLGASDGKIPRRRFKPCRLQDFILGVGGRGSRLAKGKMTVLFRDQISARNLPKGTGEDRRVTL